MTSRFDINQYDLHFLKFGIFRISVQGTILAVFESTAPPLFEIFQIQFDRGNQDSCFEEFLKKDTAFCTIMALLSHHRSI